MSRRQLLTEFVGCFLKKDAAKADFTRCQLRRFSATPNRLDKYIVTTTKNQVTTLRMNNPEKLNAWTMNAMTELASSMAAEAKNPNCKVVILTGTDPYYCAGVNLSSTLAPMHPRKLRSLIIDKNSAVFNVFIEFPKPLIVAVNGPAIGASVTSATLSDMIVASEKATFSTPFSRLHIPPEGCSSLHFPKILGSKTAERMLSHEGWQPNAKEALSIGLVQKVVPHGHLLEEAQIIAEQWIQEHKERWIIKENMVNKYKKVNLKESEDLADAFLSNEFISEQLSFLLSKKKYGPATLFFMLKMLRPFWSKLL